MKRSRLDVAYAQQPLPGKNEDRILVRDTLGLYAVFDGVSKPSGGDIAANKACQVLSEMARERMIIGSAFFEAQVRLSGLATKDIVSKKIATTATAVQIDRSERVLSYAHVCDSNLLIIRNEDLVTCTRPEVLFGGIYNFIGADGADRFCSDQNGVAEMQPGDRILLMTDGIDGGPYNYVAHGHVWEHAINEGTALLCAQKLLSLCYQDMDYVLERHDPYYVPDDKSVIVIDVGEVDV